MKIFILASRFPYPLDRGDKLRLFHQIKSLSKGNEIHLFATHKEAIEPDHLNVLKPFCKSIQTHYISKIDQALHFIRAFGSKLPLQVSTLYSSSFHKTILEANNQIQPDVIYCQLLRMAPYVEGLSGYKVLDYMDAYGIGMDRRAAIVNVLISPIYKLESRRTKLYEEVIYKKFDNHCIISQQDADLLNNDKITIIPNGIDAQHFKPQNIKPSYDIGLVGNMGYLPNVEAAEILAIQILPEYKRSQGTSISLLIAGARPHLRVKKLSADNIFVTGWVDDIRSAYGACRIICAPLYNGTGQQNKILEAMALGIPCITTAEVNAAIGGKEDSDIMIANNTSEFVEKINTLLSNDEIYKTLSDNGRKFVLDNYTWEQSINKLITIFAKSKTN